MKLMRRLTMILLYLGPVLVGAQGLGISTDQVILEMTPQIIQPNRSVSLEVISYNTDINRAQVSLYVDGVLVEQGLGLKEFSVDAPGVGESKEVRVVIRTIDQGTITKSLVLAPSQVDLLYEAQNSYAPVMYEGKKLPSHDAAVRVVAIPYLVDSAGRKIDAGSLVYTWKVDDQFRTNQSGYGRDQFEFEGSPYYRTRTISVQVESVDGSRVAHRSIEIPAYEPVVRFYPQHPLWGLDMSDAIIADEPLLLESAEAKIRSVPFYISDADSNTQLKYDWLMNGRTLATFGNRNLINLRVPDEGEGRARVSLEVTHQTKILQTAKSLFTVVFGEEATQEARFNASGGAELNFFGL